MDEEDNMNPSDFFAGIEHRQENTKVGGHVFLPPHKAPRLRKQWKPPIDTTKGVNLSPTPTTEPLKRYQAPTYNAVEKGETLKKIGEAHPKCSYPGCEEPTYLNTTHRYKGQLAIVCHGHNNPKDRATARYRLLKKGNIERNAHEITLAKLRREEQGKHIAVLKQILKELSEVDMPEYYAAKVEMALEICGRVAE